MSARTAQRLPRERRKNMKTSDKDAELDSIQASRARLEEITASIKPPPLAPGMGPPSTIHQRTPVSIPKGFKHYRRLRQRASRPSVSSKKPTDTLKHSAKARLPTLSKRDMTPYHNPLPNIRGHGHASDRKEEKKEKEEEEKEKEEEEEEEEKEEKPQPFEDPIAESPEPPTAEETKQVTDWLQGLPAEEETNQPPPSAGKRRTPSPMPGDTVDNPPRSAGPRGPTTAIPESIPEENEPTFTPAMIETIVTNMNSEDLEVRLAATKEGLKLMTSKSPPSDEFLEAGGLAPTIESLKMDNEDLQFRAAWIITNISSGSVRIRTVAESDAPQELIKLLNSPSDSVKEQAIWALGNLIGDGIEIKNLMFEAGIVKPFTEAFLKGDNSLEFKRTGAWALSTVFMDRSLELSDEEKKLLLEPIQKLKDCEDAEVRPYVLQSIGWFADIDNSHIDMILEQEGLLDLVIQNLTSSEQDFVSKALTAAGDMVTGTDDQTEEVLNAGLLPPLKDILVTSQNVRDRKEAAWIYSNILAGTQSQVQRVLDMDVLPLLVKALKTDDFTVKKEVVWALSNLTDGRTPKQMADIVDSGALETMIPLLQDFPDPEAARITETILNILKKTEELDKVKDRIRKLKGLEIIKPIQQSSNQDLCQQATEILETHFRETEDDDGASEHDEKEEEEEKEKTKEEE